MTLFPRSRLGPYEIVAPIGAGGTGEVYRAKDPRLDRRPEPLLVDHLASWQKPTLRARRFGPR